MLGSVQISHQKVASLEVNDIAQSLTSSSIKLLSLRECKISNKGFEDLMQSLSICKSILQLNLNCGVVQSQERAKMLALALQQNRSLGSLFVHGSSFGKQGLEDLCKALAFHPNIVSLDLGDCCLNDISITWVIKLLRPNGAKRGLQDLILSGNKNITYNGWVKFFIALAAENYLKTLCIDYNKLGSNGYQALCVALVACRRLETLDLEGTEMTEENAALLLHVVRNHPVSITDIVLDENKMKRTTKDAILSCIYSQAANDTSSITDTGEFLSTVSDSGTETNDAYNSDSGNSFLLQNTTESDTYASEQSSEEPTAVKTNKMARMVNKDKKPVTGSRRGFKAQSGTDSRAMKADTYSESEGEFKGALSRIPKSGYFSQALQSTEGTMDSPIHPINASQYAYSDVSAL